MFKKTRTLVKGFEEGFTLVELMIVVAIIGILAAVAIPNYQKYQARARQSEAKIALSGIYTVEKGYVVEHSSYSTCLKDIGYQPDNGGVNTRQYYTHGFSTDAESSNCGPQANQNCSNNNWANTPAGTACSTLGDGGTFFSAGAKVKSGVALPTRADMPATSMTQSAFVAAAAGNVSSSPSIAANNYDKWTIDQNKALNNAANGL